MDFPLKFESATSSFVSGVTELKQFIYTLLTNSVRQFLQNDSLGTLIPEHSADREQIEFGIEQTIRELTGATMESCNFEMRDDTLYARVVISYCGQVIESIFPV